MHPHLPAQVTVHDYHNQGAKASCCTSKMTLLSVVCSPHYFTIMLANSAFAAQPFSTANIAIEWLEVAHRPQSGARDLVLHACLQAGLKLWSLAYGQEHEKQRRVMFAHSGPASL